MLIESKLSPKSSFSILNSQAFLSQYGLEKLYDSEMDIKDEIAAWIRAARKSAGLSGEALGGKLALELRSTRGYTKANISHWETSKHAPNLKQLLGISKVTNYPLPPSIIKRAEADEKETQEGALSKLAPGYEVLLNHINTALIERDVPPHIQSTIMTLLDTCPIRVR